MEVSLEKGGVDVSGVSVLLVQEMIFTCNMDEEDERMKKEIQVCGEWSKDQVIKAGDNAAFDDVEIMITKDTPVTGFPFCDFIDAGYFLHAVAKVEAV